MGPKAAKAQKPPKEPGAKRARPAAAGSKKKAKASAAGGDVADDNDGLGPTTPFPDEEEEAAVHDDPSTDQPVIVIHPGSTLLRIGLAHWEAPLVLPHCVAWRRAGSPPPAAAAGVVGAIADFEALDEAVRPIARALRVGVVLLGDSSASEVPLVAECSAAAAAAAAAERADLAAELDAGTGGLGDAPPSAASGIGHVDPGARTLVGAAAEAAAHADPAAWVLFYPFRRGALCRRSSPAVLQAGLSAIWRAALTGGCGVRGLGLTASAMADSCAVLALPDGFTRRDGSELLDLLLSEIGLRAAIVQEAATLACVGAGLASACVVRVGASRTAVACIDELMPMPGCRQDAKTI